MDLLIERNGHTCVASNFIDVCEDADRFIQNFKILFQIKDTRLFNNQNFDFDIDDC